MNLAAKIACRTIGTAGMGLALYDASQRCSISARRGAQDEQAKYLENAYFNARTLDTASPSSNELRQKTFDLRTRNPLPTLWGKIKGGCNGILHGLGDRPPIVIFSAMAILGKGAGAKFGAIGAAVAACYDVARNGFGIGKQTPMS